MSKSLMIAREWLVEKYWDEELSLIEVAELAGCCTRTIVNWMDTYGIARRELGKNRWSRIALPPGEAALNKLLDSYQRKAAKRGLVWGLLREEFRELTQRPCHYCGDAPAMVARPSTGAKTGNHIYNGLDRKDNGVGYIEGNVVPCCKRCNWAKGRTDYNEFISYLDRMAAFRSGVDHGSNQGKH